MYCKKQLFSIPDEVQYLNCAYLSPLLKSVEQAGIQGVKAKREPWKIKPDAFFEDSKQLRALFARLIQADDPSHIALMPSASYGTATVAKNLPETSDKKIIVVGEQFPSNVYPWRRYCQQTNASIQTIEAPAKSNDRAKEWNQRILEAIDGNTLMVAMANIHWTDGTLFDLEAVAKRAHEVDAYFVIDGTQSVGALPVNVQQIQPDALICAGYKWLMGPYSTALGYFGDRIASGIPIEEGWIERENSEEFAGLVNYTDQYQPGAIRHDVGERSNFILLPMMIEALRQVVDWQPTRIQQYCKQLTQNFVEKISARGFGVVKPEGRAHHLFGIELPDHLNVDHVQQQLAQNNVYVSIRGSSLRISPHVYNTENDLMALYNILAGRN